MPYHTETLFASIYRSRAANASQGRRKLNVCTIIVSNNNNGETADSSFFLASFYASTIKSMSKTKLNWITKRILFKKRQRPFNVRLFNVRL